MSAADAILLLIAGGGTIVAGGLSTILAFHVGKQIGRQEASGERFDPEAARAERRALAQQHYLALVHEEVVTVEVTHRHVVRR